MQVIISSLILILALHFLLQGINYRKYIDIRPIENFDQQNVNVECTKPSIIPSNSYTDNKNDSNFQSNILNTNHFYVKNDNSENQTYFESDSSEQNEYNHMNQSPPPNQSENWKYKNELVMNGGELLSGITGFDDSDDFFSFNNLDSTQITDCNPLIKGSIDDDIRMGMGSIKKE